jgi:hypothetical protein
LYIEDTSTNSPNYFDVTYFPLVVGGGRHVIRFKANGLNLRLNSTIDFEMIDANGKNVFCELSKYRDRFNNYYLYFDIYDITAQGVATIHFVGEALTDLSGQRVPEEYKGVYNVRWKRTLNLLPFERNNAELLFDEPPLVSVAQVITPARLETQATASAYTFTSVTSSRDLLTITTANFEGYDRDFANSENILDPRLKNIRVNPTGEPTTMNSVPTAIREQDADIQNGFLINYTTRFNTRLVASQSFFRKDYLGGYFEFYTSESVPKSLLPELPSGITVTASLNSQLSSYNSLIVEIVNDRQAILSKPITVITEDSRYKGRGGSSSFTYKNVSQFTGSIAYVPTDQSFVTSSAVSQSYVEFTFSDLKPVSGEVYRIKTSIKLGSVTGDYKLLNDQIIRPVEYLTDAQYPNAVNYGRHESEYLLIGHFISQSILDTYWATYLEDNNDFNVVTGSISSTTMIDSVELKASYTQSRALSTLYYQNYNVDQLYTLGFYLTLDPYTELEVYMGSDPLNSYIILPQTNPKAFLKSNNMDRASRAGQQTYFGKYLGKIVNDRPTQKYYGKVLFDFETDGSGFGAPIFRSRVIDEMANTTGSAYLGEIGIKPYSLNGFTPTIVQYAVPLPQEFVEASTVSQSIDFKIDYFDYTGKQAEFTTFLDDVVLNLKAEIPSNTCQAERIPFTYDSKARLAT